MNFLYKLSDLVDERIHPRNYQIFLLIVFGTLSLGAILSTATSERVAVAGLSIPPLCPFRLLTGIECPACGITRALIFAFHGQWHDSYLMHIWGIPLALLVALQIPYRMYRISGGSGLELKPVLKKWATRAVLLSLGLPWAVKVAARFL